jgi:hypothetical protein
MSGILLVGDERPDSPALYYRVNVQGYIYHPGGKCKRIGSDGMGAGYQPGLMAGKSAAGKASPANASI